MPKPQVMVFPRHSTLGNALSTAVLQSERGFSLHFTAGDVGEYVKGCSAVSLTFHYNGVREIRNKQAWRCELVARPRSTTVHLTTDVLGICAEQTIQRSGLGGSDANVTLFVVFCVWCFGAGILRSARNREHGVSSHS